MKRSIDNDLAPWAEAGVLLLNTVLTVAKNDPGSHRGLGWECFTNRAIDLIVEGTSSVVFMLWGNDAKRKAMLVDDDRHCLLRRSHPSRWTTEEPALFSEANRFLRSTRREVCWNVPACAGACQARRGCNATPWATSRTAMR